MPMKWPGSKSACCVVKAYQVSWNTLIEANKLCPVELHHIGIPRRDPLAPYSTRHTESCVTEEKLDHLLQLLDKHKGEKVLVFVELVEDMKRIIAHVKAHGRDAGSIPILNGSITEEAMRIGIIQAFVNTDLVNTIVTGKVAEMAVDIPCASVVIQVAFRGASYVQEAQRVGRAMRVHPSKTKASMYLLYHTGTYEEEQAKKRREFLEEKEGFKYTV